MSRNETIKSQTVVISGTPVEIFLNMESGGSHYPYYNINFLAVDEWNNCDIRYLHASFDSMAEAEQRYADIFYNPHEYEITYTIDGNGCREYFNGLKRLKEKDRL